MKELLRVRLKPPLASKTLVNNGTHALKGVLKLVDVKTK